MKRILIIMILLAMMPLAIKAQDDSSLHKKVYLFSIEEDIAKPAALRVEKAMDEAKRIHADLIIVKINTFGGELDKADQIRTAFLESPIPIWAYIDNNAASAGALISIACDSIFMHSGSSIGAASVVDQTGEVLPDKYQSYMRSLMRTTAETRGRRPEIAEAMVDPDTYVAGISDSGKVLTFTTSEAIQHHYCEAQAESVEEVLAHAGIQKYTIQEQRYTALEKFIGFLVSPLVSGILIMLIIGGIYFELQQPGIGFPLILAVSAALLYFAPLYLEGLAANWEILLFFVGIVLLILEFFVIPGFGVAGVSGIICIVAALTFSLVGNVGFDFSHVPTIVLGERLVIVMLALTISLPLAMWLGKKLFESQLFGGLALNTVQDTGEGYTIAEVGVDSLKDHIGEAVTILRPAGKVLVDGKVYDAIAQVSYIEKGKAVRVVDYENSTLVVAEEQEADK